MKDFSITPINQQFITGFNAAVDSVARERLYLSFLEGPSLAMSREFAEKNIAGGWPHFVAICDGRVVGWCDISSMNRPVFEHAGILGIGIIEGYRGIGIGEALIRTAIAKAKSIGLKRIELTVRAPNVSAYKLYKKVGFIEEGRHRSAVLVDGNYEDLISMGLLF